MFGPGALVALVTDPAVILAYVGQLAILPLINLWQETAWMGTIQARLAAARGPLLAAAITGPLFALVHLPLRLGQPADALVWGLLGAAVFAIPLRIVMGWLYHRTGASILLVAALHTTFNAVNNNNLLTAAAPGNAVLAMTGFIVIAAWALVLLVATRGRLGAASPSRPAVAPAQVSPRPA